MFNAIVIDKNLNSQEKINKIINEFRHRRYVALNPQTNQWTENVGRRDRQTRRIVDRFVPAVNVGGRCGWTMLACSATVNDLDVAKWLIAQGADINLGNEFGHSPLMEAAENGHIDMMALLLSHRANINHQNHMWAGDSRTGDLDQGHTALHRAIRYGHVDAVRWLLDKGAEIKPDGSGKTPAQFAEHVLTELQNLRIKDNNPDGNRLFGFKYHRDDSKIPSLASITSILRLFGLKYPSSYPYLSYLRCHTQPETSLNQPQIVNDANKFMRYLLFINLLFAKNKNEAILTCSYLPHILLNILSYVHGETDNEDLMRSQRDLFSDSRLRDPQQCTNIFKDEYQFSSTITNDVSNNQQTLVRESTNAYNNDSRSILLGAVIMDKRNELLSQLKESLSQWRSEFPFEGIDYFYKKPGFHNQMGSWINELNQSVELYIRDINDPEKKNYLYNGTITPYDWFKNEIKSKLKPRRLVDDLKERSILNRIHYAIVSLFRAFFRVFDVILSIGAKQTKNDTPGYEPFFKLPEASLNKRVVELTKEFNDAIDALDKLKEEIPSTGLESETTAYNPTKKGL